MMPRAAAVAALVAAALALAGAAHANTVTPSCTSSSLAPINCAAWHAGPVTLRWDWSPAGETGFDAGCATQTFTRDTPPGGTSVSCAVTWGADTVTHAATVFVDNFPPLISSVTPARPPDHDGWYNHPVAFSFNGSDATSGIASCDTVTYAGPDGPQASVVGGCIDLAGNHGFAGFPLAYDGTPPGAAQVTKAPGNGTIRLSWVLPSDAAGVRVVRLATQGTAARKTIYQGSATHVTDHGLKNGVRYHYLVTDFDQAGNTSAVGESAIPTASTLRPLTGTVVQAPPRLTWKQVKGADYYNVQLYKGKRKILSAWPHGAHLALPLKWHYRGKHRRLAKGVYRWYVWPGYGERAAHRYGNRIGGSSFRYRSQPK